MTEYTVNWTIELSADSPEQAAKMALEIHRDRDSIATFFEVAPTTPCKAQLIDAGN